MVEIIQLPKPIPFPRRGWGDISVNVPKLPGGKINQVNQPIPKAGTSQGGNGPIVPLLETVAHNKTLVLNQIQMVKTSNKRCL